MWEQPALSQLSSTPKRLLSRHLFYRILINIRLLEYLGGRTSSWVVDFLWTRTSGYIRLGTII